MLFKKWNRGRFGFWLVGTAYMKRRDEMVRAVAAAHAKLKEKNRIEAVISASLPTALNAVLMSDDAETILTNLLAEIDY